MHWIFLLPLAWGLLILVKPEVNWRLQSWQYRDPEANHPSDAWFLTQRLIGLALIFISLLMWAQLAALTPTETSTDRADASPEPRPTAERHDLTTTSEEVGRISGYTVDAEDELTVHLSLNPCAIPIGLFNARESEDTITLTANVPATDTCLREDDPFRPLRETVTLDEPVGDREVVDSEGTPVRLCKDRC